MGTRADFYVGRGEQAEWLGSIAMDGYPDGIPATIRSSTTEPDYRRRVAAFIARKRDGTRPVQGWPWPWATSHTTDYAYALDGGQVWASHFGHDWWAADAPQPEEDCEGDTVAEFPDMRSRQSIAWDERSGMIFVRL